MIENIRTLTNDLCVFLKIAWKTRRSQKSELNNSLTFSET